MYAIRSYYGIYQQRFGIAQMFRPVGGQDLVFDQRVHGIGVRDTQQRLRQAHQRNAFVVLQPVFLQKGIQQRMVAAARTHPLYQRGCPILDSLV